MCPIFPSTTSNFFSCFLLISETSIFCVKVIRATVPRLELDAVFEQKNEIAKAVEEELEKVRCVSINWG